MSSGFDFLAALKSPEMENLFAVVDMPTKLRDVYKGVTELVAADREYDATLTALKDVTRHIAERGWMELEFDAQRKAGERFVAATIRRDRALERFAEVKS